ncbi:MAG: hypothetical protein ABJ056_00525 [Halioglobus sp.]
MERQKDKRLGNTLKNSVTLFNEAGLKRMSRGPQQRSGIPGIGAGDQGGWSDKANHAVRDCFTKGLIQEQGR